MQSGPPFPSIADCEFIQRHIQIANESHKPHTNLSKIDQLDQSLQTWLNPPL